jgi:hypothetical protein
MSVRATERLVGDLVVVTGLSNSPKMVVQSVDIDVKQVKTIWFSNANESEEGIFPASSLDRAEEKSSSGAKKSAAKGKKPAGKR